MTGIRADANTVIASGHVMRCITIAKELTALGEKVTFFLADKESRELFDAFAGDAAGIEPVVLDSDWRDMEGELPRLKEELAKRKIDTLLVDSYSVTARYFEELSNVCRVAYLDDLGKEAYQVDVLINYSGYYRSLKYEEMYREMKDRGGRDVRFLLGLMYAPLRQQFKRIDGCDDRKALQDSSKALLEDGSFNILLTAGGGDTKEMLMPSLRAATERGLIGALEDGTNITWQVVVGGMVPNPEEIISFAKEYDGVQVHRNVTDMAGLMNKCDLAITAAGTVLTECAALGLPTIFYQVADNQKYNVEYWNSTGGMLFAGDVTEAGPDQKEEVLSSMMESVQKIVKKREMLTQMSTSLSGITDGRGAERIAAALLTRSIS